MSAALAWLLVVGGAGPYASVACSQVGSALFDFRPVFRNRSAMAYAIAYCIHTLEMNACAAGASRFWPSWHRRPVSGAMLSPTATLTLLGLLGTLASVLGNEAAIQVGRRRLISFAMIASAVCAAFWIHRPVPSDRRGFDADLWGDRLARFVLAHGGTAGTAEPSRRGATLAVHSMLGYIGGFVGPLAVGWVLDLQGGMSATAWAAAFSMMLHSR